MTSPRRRPPDHMAYLLIGVGCDQFYFGMVRGVHTEDLVGKRLADRFDTVKVEKNFLEPLEPNEHPPSLGTRHQLIVAILG